MAKSEVMIKINLEPSEETLLMSKRMLEGTFLSKNDMQMMDRKFIWSW